MKKLILLSIAFLLLAFAPVFAQTSTVYYSTKSGLWGDASGASSPWAKVTYTGNPAEITSSTTFGGVTAADFPGTTNANSTENSTPQIVVIRATHTITISDDFYYNGRIIIEGGAALVFSKTSGDKGRLIMNATSVIDVRMGGDIRSISTNDQGIASNHLTIGSENINGKYINLLPSPPLANSFPSVVLIDERFIHCIGTFSAGNQASLTNQQLIELVACLNATVQPVELLALNAKAEGGDVLVEWTIAREWNFSHYVVEWSADAENFYTAGTVLGLGTDTGAQSYSLRHQPGQSGTLYYRLLSVDIDGTVEDKGLRVVRLGNEVFNAYSKQGRLHINYNGPAVSKVTLMDTSGRQVLLTSLNEEGIETAGIRAGIYLLRISNSLEQKTKRIFIQ